MNVKDMTAEQVFEYALTVIRGRWAEAEPIIMQDAFESYRYAVSVIKGRWAEAEPIISQDVYWAACYANNVINGRWPEAESLICTDAISSCFYARNVIKGRWLEGEEVIAQDEVLKFSYLDTFFPNQEVVTKDEVDEIEWSRLGLEGYFANAELLKRPTSLLDMVIE